MKKKETSHNHIQKEKKTENLFARLPELNNEVGFLVTVVHLSVCL